MNSAEFSQGTWLPPRDITTVGSRLENHKMVSAVKELLLSRFVRDLVIQESLTVA